MTKTYTFWRGLWALTKMYFFMYKEEHETRIQIGGHEKMTQKKRETEISDLITLLGEKVGMIQAGYIYNCYSNRYDQKHEADEVNQEEYKKQKTLHFSNYLRAYYQINIKQPKKTLEIRNSAQYVGKTIEQENQEDERIENNYLNSDGWIDQGNYRW